MNVYFLGGWVDKVIGDMIDETIMSSTHLIQNDTCNFVKQFLM